MRKSLYYISLCLISFFAFSSCDIHELPAERYDKVPFQLHLNFDTEMPLHQEIFYTNSGETESKSSIEKHDIRYIVNVYRTDKIRSDARLADTTFVFTKSDITNLNYTANLLLPEGVYDFKVWADYVDANSNDDKYYDTRDFSDIILLNKDNYRGSNDYRDAFRGYTSAEVLNPDFYTGSIVNTIDNQATIQMERPMGKFKFISTDTEIFLARVAQKLYEQGKLSSFDSDSEADTKSVYEQLLESIAMGEYYVLFRYNIFMPCSFNMFTDKPSDSWMGVSFTSNMEIENEREMLLGYDYIFVNGLETTLSISLEVYNDEGEKLSSTNPINVPIVRNKLTVIKGEFLTSKASGGVTINPGYDGEDYNIEIY